MIEFTKNLFIKKQYGLTFDKYDLTQDVHNIEKNYKITEGTLYGICGLTMVFYSWVATLLPWENTNFLSFIVAIPILLSLIYMSGGMTGFMIYNLAQPVLNKFSIFKKIHYTSEKTKEKLHQLCEDEHFQFSLLSYLKAIREPLDNFTFPEHKEDKKRRYAAYDIGSVISKLKNCFAQKDYEEAVNYLMQHESIAKIQNALEIEKILILKGDNRYEKQREASIRSQNLDNYEEALNNFITQPKSNKSISLEKEIEVEKYL